MFLQFIERLSLFSICNTECSYDWTCEEGMGGGVLTVIGSHVIDIVSAAIRQRAIRVHGMTRRGLAVKGEVNIRMFTFTSHSLFIFRITYSHYLLPGRITSDRFASFNMEMNGGALVNVTLDSQEGLQNFDISFSVIGSQGFISYRSDPSGILFVYTCSFTCV